MSIQILKWNGSFSHSVNFFFLNLNINTDSETDFVSCSSLQFYILSEWGWIDEHMLVDTFRNCASTVETVRVVMALKVS